MIVIGDSEADEKLAKINNIEFALIKNGYAKKILKNLKKNIYLRISLNYQKYC